MKKYKLIRKLISIILLGACLVIGIDLYMIYSGGKMIFTGTSASWRDEPFIEDADCVMVLGAGVYADRTPTPMLQDRLDKAIELYKSGAVKKLLLSGDNGQVEYNEVETMKIYALDQGVKEEDIFLDHAGFSTYDSMYRARDVFAVKSMIVVTQEYHEFRALKIADCLGIEVMGICAEKKSYAGDVYREIREILARNKDFFKCIIKPEPTLLGDVIDIHGDGRETW